MLSLQKIFIYLHLKKNINTICDFFSYKLSKNILKVYSKFDFIIARNVVAHLQNPNDLFKGVKNLLLKDGIFVIEVPNLYTFYSQNQYDNVFHEHIGFHSLKSILDLSNLNKLKLFDCEIINSQGGSLRCFISTDKSKYKIKKSVTNIIIREKKSGLFKFNTWIQFSKKVLLHKIKLYNLISKLKLSNNLNCSVRGFR